MRKQRDRARKGNQLLLERSRAVPTGGRRLTASRFVNNRQKRKLKDDSDTATTKIKKRKITNIIQDTENRRKPSCRGSYSVMCHQCQRNDKKRVVNCSMCCKRRFCITCITHWYPLLSEEEIAERCPVCRGYCNCNRCLRKKINTRPRKKVCTADEVKHAWHVVQYLYPWFREFHEQQNAEKRKEAEIKGVDASDLIIPKAKYKSEHICCSKCNAYIVDFHWSCRNCTCLLCLSCCRELLESDIPTTSEVLPCCVSDQLDPDCDDGVCESPVLELKSILGENFISKLCEEVSEIAANDTKFRESEGDISRCSCATRANGKVNLFCPMAREVKEGHSGHFGWHWVKGEPVIVRDVLELTSGLSWEPRVMWRVLREINHNGQGSELSMLAIDCRDGADMEISILQFFKGYQEGLSHEDDWPLLLRLKNCHKDSSFAEHSPCHEEEFMAALPFPEYTDPLYGPLNLAAKLPANKPRPELEPKIDIAYGVQEELMEGDSVAKLHYELYDVVNILMHNKEVRLTNLQHNALSRKHKRKREEVQKMTISDDYGGSLWDIWRREDVPKLWCYLTEHARDFTNRYNPPLYSVDDLIRYESVYLTMEHKRRLKDEHGIEAWTFEQKLGDAVFVPAGCPYQVRNLKSCINVRLGFVSPESFRVCIGLADKLCVQSRAKEDKLEVKRMALYALEKAMSCLRLEIPKIKGNKQKVDDQKVESKDNKGVDSNRIPEEVPIIKADNNMETTNVPDPVSHDFYVDPSSRNEPAKSQVTIDVHDLEFHKFDSGQLKEPNPETEDLVNTEFGDFGSDLGPQNKPDNNIVAVGASDMIFNDFLCYVPEPEFHDFDADRVEKLFKPNQIWAIYAEQDGMPRFYAFIQKVISLSPFEVRIAFLGSHTDSEFGDINWVLRGLEKTWGEFHLCQGETVTNINMFSHQVQWEKGQNGMIKIIPQKGDIWALYRNWSPDWDEITPDETVYRYDMVEVLEEYSEKNGISVAPLLKVNGFNAVFRKDPDPARVKWFPRKEMCRFAYHVTSYRLTDDDAGAQGGKLTGCVELDSAATPVEWLEATAPGIPEKE